MPLRWAKIGINKQEGRASKSIAEGPRDVLGQLERCQLYCTMYEKKRIHLKKACIK